MKDTDKRPEAQPEDGFAAVGHLVQEIPRRCSIKRCKARPSLMVAMADQAGIIGEDSLLVAASCAEHPRAVSEALGQMIVAARIKHDHPGAVRAEIGDSIRLGRGEPS